MCFEDSNYKSDWFALRTRPRHEKSVAEMLEAKGIERFLPVQHVRRRWSQRWKELELPLFPGYLFASFERGQWGQVISVPGVIDAVRFGNTLAAVDPRELMTLRQAAESQCSLEECPYFGAGEPIQITSGPLAGLSGTVAKDEGRSQLVLSITLLQRSVRVTVERHSLQGVRPAA